MRKAASVDPLTGLRNRAAFYMDVHSFMEKKQSFCLFYMDLNRFKSINDEFGHPVGDIYLKAFSVHITNILKKNGRLYRLAGDEFVCIFQGEKKEKQQFLIRLYNWPQRLPGCDVPFIGFCHGFSCYPADGNELNDLISLADQRMYQSKKASKST